MLKQISLLEGYESVLDCYYISDCGKVYNCKTNRFVNIGDNGNGYKRVGLKIKGVRKWKNAYIHRLVAIAFIKTEHSYLEVNHIDEDKSNNNVENLEWVTRKQNVNHGTSIARQKLSKRNDTFVYNYKGEFLKRFTSISDASREILGRRNTRGNIRVKDFVFMVGEPTLEKFKEITEKSAYKPVVMKDVITGEIEIFPSQKHLERKLGKVINISEYIKEGSIFNGKFSFELYKVDRIGMPNLHE